MSNQSLARTYRPQRFEDLVGQERVTTALKNAIASNRIPPAYLFCGPRGVGKTTAARLIAMCITCEQGPTAEPCGICSECKEIRESRSLDIIEMDGASHTGVDDIRELRDSAQFAPSRARSKIFIIDEVHMLSNSAFNALLKILEEPPPHLHFIFATTEPDRIPITVLSRCQRYDFKRISIDDVVMRLTQVLEAEGLTADESGLKDIAHVADGGMRDALSLLDQAIAIHGAALTHDHIRDALGLVSQEALVELAAAIIERRVQAAIDHFRKLYQGGYEPMTVFMGLTELLRDYAISRLTDNLSHLTAETQELLSGYDKEEIRRLFQDCLQCLNELHVSQSLMLSAESCILRLSDRPSHGSLLEVSAALNEVKKLRLQLQKKKPSLRANQESPKRTPLPTEQPNNDSTAEPPPKTQSTQDIPVESILPPVDSMPPMPPPFVPTEGMSESEGEIQHPNEASEHQGQPQHSSHSALSSQAKSSQVRSEQASLAQPAHNKRQPNPAPKEEEEEESILDSNTGDITYGLKDIEVDGHWLNALNHIQRRDFRLCALLMQSVLLKAPDPNAQKITIKIAFKKDLYQDLLEQDVKEQTIQKAFELFFKKSCSITIEEISSSDAEMTTHKTTLEFIQEAKEREIKRLHGYVASHPFIQEIQEQLDATLSTVEPTIGDG